MFRLMLNIINLYLIFMNNGLMTIPRLGRQTIFWRTCDLFDIGIHRAAGMWWKLPGMSFSISNSCSHFLRLHFFRVLNPTKLQGLDYSHSKCGDSSTAHQSLNWMNPFFSVYWSSNAKSSMQKLSNSEDNMEEISLDFPYFVGSIPISVARMCLGTLSSSSSLHSIGNMDTPSSLATSQPPDAKTGIWTQHCS